MPLTGSKKTLFSTKWQPKTEWVNGNMADVIPGPGWKLLIHIRSDFDRALQVGKKKRWPAYPPSLPGRRIFFS
jgi:hypothetical protein